MSTFGRIIHIPAGRRAYSYFSSRSGGGGRYFNSAKPPKATVVAGKAGVPSSKADPAADNKQTGVQSSKSNSPSTTESAPSSKNDAVGSDTSSKDHATSTNQDSAFDDSFASPRQHIPTQAITAKELKMHQFFSLHRPLLLIPQPSSLFRDLPSNHTLFSPLPPSEADIHKGVMQALSGYGEPGFRPTDPFLADADADTARQLTRALTMNKAGATVSWEETLKQLGLDVSKDAERVNLQKQFDKDWEDVMLESTKRKRRRKMKKHKLKKRRRATRAERLRLK